MKRHKCESCGKRLESYLMAYDDSQRKAVKVCRDCYGKYIKKAVKAS